MKKLRTPLFILALLGLTAIPADAQVGGPQWKIAGTLVGPVGVVNCTGGCSFSGGTYTIPVGGGGGGVTSLTGGGGVTVSAATGAVTLGSACGGDLAGTVAAATVGGLQGRVVSNAAPANGQVLAWDASGVAWTPTTDTHYASWYGSASGPSIGFTKYLNGGLNNAGSGAGQATPGAFPMGLAASAKTAVRITATLDNAPGTGESITFRFGVATTRLGSFSPEAMILTISDTNTTGTVTGADAVAQFDIVGLQMTCTNNGGQSAAGIIAVVDYQ